MSWLDDWVDAAHPSLVALRRQLHAHPEPGRAEHATTALLVHRLTAAGLSPKVLDGGTGVVCDVGTGSPVVGLRADIDALPLEDLKDVPWRSQRPGLCHACGHDVHTSVVLGAGLALARHGERGRERLERERRQMQRDPDHGGKDNGRELGRCGSSTLRRG